MFFVCVCIAQHNCGFLQTLGELRNRYRFCVKPSNKSRMFLDDLYFVSYLTVDFGVLMVMRIKFRLPGEIDFGKV